MNNDKFNCQNCGAALSFLVDDADENGAMDIIERFHKEAVISLAFAHIQALKMDKANELREPRTIGFVCVLGSFN